MGQDSVVNLATRYRLDGQDVGCWWGQDFLYPPLEPTQRLVQWEPGHSRG